MKAYCEKMYLEYFNDFLTMVRFAEYYGFNYDYASRLLAIGKKLNDRRSKS